MNSLRLGSRVQGSFSAKPTSIGGFGFGSQHSSLHGLVPIPISAKRLYSHSRDNTKNKGVPIAFFADYTDGKTFTVNPPLKEDKTALVGFVKPPKGYEAHPEQALKSGFNGLWIKRNEYSDTTSIYTLAFDDSFAGSIDQYMQERTQTFIDRYQSSDGKHYAVELGSAVTDHLTKKNSVQCKAALFSTGQTSLYEQPLLGKLIMLMKTPGGFWELGLHAPLKHLMNPTTHISFTEAVRDLKIFWRDGDHADIDAKTTKVTNKQSLLD
jgi:hypothetical protein